MAANREEIDVIVDGTVLRDPIADQTFIQNLFKNRGLWESREGFGTLLEFNGDLNARYNEGQNVDTGTWGLEKHLGSFLFSPSEDVEQIISVFYGSGWTGLTPGFLTDDVKHYYVHIYDITTNNRWSEVLYTHTSQENVEDQLTGFYQGFYEARSQLTNYKDPLLATQTPFFFAEYLGKLYFGSKDSGVWVYNPAPLIRTRVKRINNVNNRNELIDSLTNHYSETSLITPLAFKNGLSAEAYTYVQTSDINNIVDIDANNGRLIFAAGKSIYFSDVGVSNAIVGSNVFTFHELRSDITAIKSFNELVLVWSKDQMFVYQPSQGFLLTGGRAVEVNNEIGCLGPNAVLFRQNRVWWVDGNGVYSTGTGFSAEEISLPIKLFFTDSTTNPFIHYFTNNGFISTNQNRPDFIYSASDNLDDVHLAFDQKHEQLFVVFPKLNIAWVYKGGWYLWSFNSIAESDLTVSSISAVDYPFMVCSSSKTFAVGGKLINTVSYIPNSNGEGADPIGSQFSWRLFELGRGGALDGSTNDFNEGKRETGYYDYSVEGSGDDYRIYYDPIQKWGNKLSADATQSTIYAEEDDLWYLPIYITPDGETFNKITSFTIELSYDATRWQPIDWAGSPSGRDLLFLLPTERSVQYLGFSPGGAVPGPPPSGVSRPVVGTVRIQFNTTLSASSWAWMNLNPTNKNPVIWIPFKKINRDTNPGESTNIIIQAGANFTYTDGRGSSASSTNITHIKWNPGWNHLRTDVEVANGVDWVYKTSQLGMEGVNQIKARGSYSLVSSRGVGAKIKNWSLGVWNTIAGSDYKDYVTQTVDVTDTPKNREAIVSIFNKSSIRTRFKPLTTLLYRLFGGSATYGSNVNALEPGNYLVDTEEADTIATSDSVRGESVNYTFFGFLLNKANKIQIRKIKIPFVAVAGRRRRGR